MCSVCVSKKADDQHDTDTWDTVSQNVFAQLNFQEEKAARVKQASQHLTLSRHPPPEQLPSREQGLQNDELNSSSIILLIVFMRWEPGARF